MIRHDKKDKIAILTAGLIILMAVLIAIWVNDKSYGADLFLYVAITLGIGFIMPKFLFKLEKKKVWVYEKRCALNETTVLKHAVTLFSTFVIIMMIYHLPYIDHTAMIIVGIIAGIITALAEFFTSKKGLEQ